MLLTRKEAQAVWCPAHQTEDRSAVCLVDCCAMWRWYDPATMRVPVMTIAEAQALGGPHAEPPLEDRRLGDARRGYCGLAGHPKVE